MTQRAMHGLWSLVAIAMISGGVWTLWGLGWALLVGGIILALSITS